MGNPDRYRQAWQKVIAVFSKHLCRCDQQYEDGVSRVCQTDQKTVLRDWNDHKMLDYQRGQRTI